MRAVREYDPRLAVLGLPGSALLRAAEAAGLEPVAEGFADRGYTPAGTLVPRSDPGALVHGEDEVVARAVQTATDGTVVAVGGTVVAAPVRSLCVHGDTRAPSTSRGACGRRRSRRVCRRPLHLGHERVRGDGAPEVRPRRARRPRRPRGCRRGGRGPGSG